jgi:hypothetical protein
MSQSGRPLPVSAERLKKLVAEAKELLGGLIDIANLKPSKGGLVENLAKAAKRVPSTEQVIPRLEAFRSELEAVLASAAKQQQDWLGAAEAAFIQSRRAQAVPIREFDHSWRVGPLEIELDRENARVRVRYNHEPITTWTAISSETDLEELYTQALATLQQSLIQQSDFESALWAAYEAIVNRRLRRAEANPEVVPALDLYREVRIEMVRAEIVLGRGDRRISRIDFPLWVFLYNMDTYLNQYTAMKGRLIPQTGSQSEQAKGLKLHGLKPTDDYNIYCYFRPAQQAK